MAGTFASIMAVVTLLGIAQDGGRPQPGCTRACCQGLTEQDYRSPVSLGIKTNNGTTLLIEATRDLGRQLRMMKSKHRSFVHHTRTSWSCGWIGTFRTRNNVCKKHQTSL